MLLISKFINRNLLANFSKRLNMLINKILIIKTWQKNNTITLLSNDKKNSVQLKCGVVKEKYGITIITLSTFFFFGWIADFSILRDNFLPWIYSYKTDKLISRGTLHPWMHNYITRGLLAWRGTFRNLPPLQISREGAGQWGPSKLWFNLYITRGLLVGWWRLGNWPTDQSPASAFPLCRYNWKMTFARHFKAR